MACREELALDARKLLSRNGHSVDEVYDVDAEGEVTVIAFRHGYKVRTAYVRVKEKSKDKPCVESIVVRDRWDV